MYAIIYSYSNSNGGNGNRHQPGSIDNMPIVPRITKQAIKLGKIAVIAILSDLVKPTTLKKCLIKQLIMI